MKTKTIALFLLAGLLLGSLDTYAQQSSTSPANWHANIELLPLGDDQAVDLVNLVPKQSIMMKAYVWYPSTEIWIVKYPDWDMPGASIEKYDTTTQNLRRDTEGYLQYGHTQNYILTPVDIGALELTQTGIDVSATKNGSAILPLAEPLQLKVDLPDGVYSIDEFLPAYDLKVEQEFYLYTNAAGSQSIEIDKVSNLTLEQGELLERRISINASGTRGSSIPSLERFANGENVQTESRAEDVKGIFGFEGGLRVESFFYSPGEGGAIVLPDVDIQWWHLKDKELRSIDVPGVSFDSVEVVAYEESISLSWWEKHSTKLLSGLVVALIAIVVLLILAATFKTLIKRSFVAIRTQVNRALNSEWMASIKLIITLAFGSKTKVKPRLLRWQFANDVSELPEDINNYLYSSDQPATQRKKINRWQLVKSCLGMQRQLNNQRKRKARHQLPEL